MAFAAIAPVSLCGGFGAGLCPAGSPWRLMCMGSSGGEAGRAVLFGAKHPVENRVKVPRGQSDPYVGGRRDRPL